jgi:alcohol dehydrogenase (cytochrome c)
MAQPLDPASLFKALGESWPTYAGDYSSKRYSSLKQVNQSNVKNLTLAWVSRVSAGTGGGGRGGGAPTIVGGEAPDTGSSGAQAANVRGSILEVNGVLYLSAPDNAWAVDARDGHQLWHYFWRTKGGTHIGNRGLGMWGNWLYLETPDDYLICLDARTGKERWHKEIANFNQQYFSTMAPVAIGNHILIGTGNDLDEPGYVQARDPETGDVQWTFYTVPMKEGDAGLDTWGSLDGAKHGAGNVWIPGSYDPETHLYIFGTGNPSPAYTNPPSRAGDNLYTCSIVAINVDTGKMAWYYQVNPHDTHDWDSTETPILVDGDFNGKPRKMVLHADRNGYFFTLDRLTGEHLVTGKFSEAANWVKEINAKDSRFAIPRRIPPWRAR